MSWILGIVAVCGLGVSFILALIYLAVTLFGKAGKHIGCIAIPGGCVARSTHADKSRVVCKGAQPLKGLNLSQCLLYFAYSAHKIWFPPCVRKHCHQASQLASSRQQECTSRICSSVREALQNWNTCMVTYRAHTCDGRPYAPPSGPGCCWAASWRRTMCWRRC